MIRLPQNWDSYDVLFALAREARSYLCVGVQDGECLRRVLNGGRPSRLVLCDTWGREHGGTGRGSHAHIEALLAEHKFAGVVEWLDGRSQDLIPRLPAEPGFDLCYVDGSHAEADAFEDFKNCWPRTARWLVAHDIRQPAVWRAFGAAFEGERGVSIACSLFGFGTAVVERAP
jgi:hypothetical protein